MKYKIAYLKCKTYEGMFSTERGVEVRDSFGKKHSGFFPNERIINDRLEVMIRKEDHDNVLLDVDGMANTYGFFNAACIWVKKSDINY